MQLDTTMYRVCNSGIGYAAQGGYAYACARQPIEVTMNEHVQTAHERPAVQSAGAGIHPQSLSPLRAAAHHRSGAPDPVRHVRRQPPRRCQPRDARQALRQGLCRAHDAPLWPPDHGRAGVPQHEPLDAAAGSARPHPPARPRGEGVHRAPRRGHAAAHSGDRRRDSRPHHPAGQDGPDRGFCLPPAGHHHLRHARHPRGASRGVLHRLARQRAASSIRCR